ncbi:DUF4352 domain-containing protein [Nocardiopsis exhalans]|uniref:DUF4352 domain-containing protein n=1 Tax=Nocardiopsis exhalans TaxID=163604 RepID=A0ABY5D2B4_9ACTN|nr:DUF4352 domain-containing protein [Nocardiopsis exhalans]USY17304.1 DUF4352 domain-containing protein [Nocardiopsis exhalans]
MSSGMQDGPGQYGPYQGGQPPGGPQQPPYGPQQFQQSPYGQQQYVPPQYGPPPQAVAPQKRRKWPWVLLAVFVLIVGMIVANNGGGQEAETTSASEENATGAETEEAAEEEPAEESGDFAMGEAAQLGDWMVTVNGTETAASYGEEFFEEQAQGEFVIVDMTVENGGSESTTFDDSALSLIDSDGNSHAASTLLGADTFFLQQINPGNQASGEALFDVPEGTEPVALEVEDTWSFDEPIRIQLN